MRNAAGVALVLSLALLWSCSHEADAASNARPVTGPAPATLAEFVARWQQDPGAAGGILFTASDLPRLFATVERAQAEPGASHVRADLEGDAREEVAVAIGDGWWGRHVDVLLLAPTDGGWQLSRSLRIPGMAHGVPRVSALACGARRWLDVHWRDGHGTGYQHSSAHLLEVGAAGLTEVLVRLHSGESIVSTSAIDEVLAQPLSMVAEPGSTAILASTEYQVQLSGDHDPNGKTRDWYEVPVQYRQTASGQPFVLVDVAGRTSFDLDELWQSVARSWFTKHRDAAIHGARQGDAAQRNAIRRLGETALAAGPSAEISAMLAMLPPAESAEPSASRR